ncbi:T9SS type A sorting domain-containing protein [Larkinella insperata]|uniref:T9SS type A sorting domain-containing protein n=1 Tax=Larkinella insperata TaxID=332158 RepID=A0ABW3Q181_9BACT|nr:T9SS type A sorting domain-containing protein [Larkinella insperata]
MEAQAISTIAGTGEQGFGGDGGPAINALLSNPNSVALGLQGDLLFIDSGNTRIRKISSNGIITTIAGRDWEEGTTIGDGGPATQAGLINPNGLAQDAQGNVYFADNNRIRKIDTQGIITTIAGSTESGFSGDGGPATQALLEDPRDIAIDSKGTLYIADSFNQCIRKIDANGIITTVAGVGESIGQFSGDGGPATEAHLFNPLSITFDAQDNLYIADSWNYRVRKVDSQGIITTVAGNGSKDYNGDGKPALQASLEFPRGLAFDEQGNLYICDLGNLRVRKVDLNGMITTVAGTGKPGYNGDGGNPTSALLGSPVEAIIDKMGNLLFSDSGNHRIRKVSQNAQPLAITSLFLIDADRDTTIQDLGPQRDNPPVIELNLKGFPTRKLNIQALTTPASVGSVVFQLSGRQTLTQIENAAPYALFKDDGGNFRGWTPAVGSYTLTATPYSGPNGTGTAGNPVTISFTVVDHIRVDHFRLIDPLTNEAGFYINDGFRMSLPRPQSGEAYNIQAVTNPATVGSVIIQISGQHNHTQVENGAPYALYGDNNGDYKGRRKEVGNYTLTATPYSGPNGTGTAGIPLTVRFEVYSRQSMRLSAEGELDSKSVKVFPNPFTESFTIESKGAQSSAQPVGLYDLLGRRVWQGMTTGNKQVVPVGSQLGAGAYILRVGEGRRAKTIKVVKAP